MSHIPTLYLTIGLPGMGKTTAARRLEEEQHLLRLSKDEWMKSLYGEENPEAASDVIEGRLIDIALRCLALGTSVVLDFGLWSRHERSALRAAAHEVGARVQGVYCTVSPEEQRRRATQRYLDDPSATWELTDDMLAQYASVFEEPTPGELEDSEPLDTPPAGFATWEAWRRHRWYPVVP